MEEKKHKTFFYRFIGTIGVVVLVSMAGSSYLYSKHIPQTNNDLLINRALKILSTRNDLETIIVGDSSAGNAIDAAYFESLSGLKTQNLALTGSFGFIGSYNIIRHAQIRQKKLKNVLIINTLDVWRRPFNEQAFFDTLDGLPAVELKLSSGKVRLSTALHYKFNPREIYWYFKYRLHPLPSKESIENDYLVQHEERFSNGKKKLEPKEFITSLINEDNTLTYEALGKLCTDLSLHCIFMHGPIHRTVYEKSYSAIAHINNYLKKEVGLFTVTKVFSYPPEKIGDSVDHIDPLYKKEVTKDYFETIKDTLVYE